MDNLIPAVIEFGRQGFVDIDAWLEGKNLVISNKGKGVARDVSVELIGSDSISLSRPDDAIGNIGAGESRRLPIDLDINWGADSSSVKVSWRHKVSGARSVVRELATGNR